MGGCLKRCDVHCEDEIPFIHITRSFGDLWSYSTEHNKYHMSPIPDVKEYVVNN